MFQNLKNKKRIISITLVIVIILIFIIIFIKFNYKNLKIGNNMSNKSIEEIEEYILNISSYEAEVSVVVEGNKTTNKYVILQQYISPNKIKQTVIEPRNIEGLEVIYDGNSLTINNSKLNLRKIYENYEYITNNFLCLESFIEDYKNGKENSNTSLKEENEEIVLEVNMKSNNKYIQNKKLYISKNTGKPTKLLIEDINEKTVVYILYNEIKINDLNKN